MDTALIQGQMAADRLQTVPGSLHIGIAGPIATVDIARLLSTPNSGLPAGYAGAPFLTTLIEALLACGHRVSAFTLSTDLPAGSGGVVSAEGPGLQVHYCPMRARAWRSEGLMLGRIVDLYRLERKVLQHTMQLVKPDVIHAHWAYEFAWAAQSSRIPTLITSHDSPFAVARFYKGLVLGGYRRLRAVMAWHVLRRATHVSTVSPYMRRQLQSLCRVPIDIVSNPLSADALHSCRSSAPRPLRVLMVCNGWSAIKNPEPALLGLASLSRRLPDVELIFLGQAFGPGEMASQWWAAHNLQGRARFVGVVPYPKVIDWMNCSDVLLHPSLEESFGMVLAEAMATGMAVVAGRDSGAVPWVLDDCGRLVDVRSPEAICDALFELLSNGELRKSLAPSARNSVARRFSAAAVAQQYLDLYRRALARVELTSQQT